jgi:DNA mismatch repair ATPase MutS
LKQLGLITVLAQIGSYVPADEAFIPIRDLLCTRIGTGDDFEHNLSSFMLEMKEAAFICRSVTPKSLVLVDELGRATSNEDGCAIAWAVSEHLLKSKATTFFVTHFIALAQLQGLYSNVCNISFGKLDGDEGAEGEEKEGTAAVDRVLVYDHKVQPGACTVASSYGIEMASVCGWPAEVVSKARALREYIVAKIGSDGGVLIDIEMAKKQADARENLADTAKRLCVLAQEGTTLLSEEAQKNFLCSLFEELLGEGDIEELEMEEEDDDNDDDEKGAGMKLSLQQQNHISLLKEVVGSLM